MSNADLIARLVLFALLAPFLAFAVLALSLWP